MKKLFEIIKSTVNNKLDIGIGTLNDLNNYGDAKYPLLWIQLPTPITNSTNGSYITSQLYSVTLLFLQSGLITDNAEMQMKYFDDMNRYVVGFFNLINEVDEIDEPTIISNETMVHKKQDNVHYGWQVTFQCRLIVKDNCCNLYE